MIKWCNPILRHTHCVESTWENHPAWRKNQSKAYLVDLLPRLSYSGSTGYGSKKNQTPKKTDPEWFWYILVVFGLSTNQPSIDLGKLRTRATSPWWTSHTTALPLSQAARCQVLVNLPHLAWGLGISAPPAGDWLSPGNLLLSWWRMMMHVLPLSVLTLIFDII